MKRTTAFYLGLFITTLVMLAMEVVCTRLFSVLTWYYLGFFAISMAMLGMTAGALLVYFRPETYTRKTAPVELARFATLYAISIPIFHLLLINMQLRTDRVLGDFMQFLSLLLASLFTAVPFFLSGVVVSLALTKTDLPVGRVYAVDLIGAAVGCIAAILLLESVDATSALLVLAAFQAAAAMAFAASGGASPGRPRVLLAVSLALAAALNAGLYPHLVRVHFTKGAFVETDVLVDEWNTHSRILARRWEKSKPPYWGSEVGAPMDADVTATYLDTDGSACTMMARYSGNPDSARWIQYDVTNLAHYLRPADADAAVIGVGGGRDVLAALVFGCRSVTGVEFNAILARLVTKDFRDAANLATDPRVSIVHDEGRAFMARHPGAYDILQMSLIDTWASTSAGAMMMTENGLYTVEAWRTFLTALKPAGLFTVSRWFNPDRPGETARTLSLGVAALLDMGVADPSAHLILASRGRIATLILSRDPFGSGQMEKARTLCAERGVTLLAAPGITPSDEISAKLAVAKSPAELARAANHPFLNLQPPRDSSPFFFNVLKPSAWLRVESLRNSIGGVIAGNLYAGSTMIALLSCILLLDLGLVFVPLALTRRKLAVGGGTLAAAMLYFMLIGLGFMLVEISLMQRFSLLLGHPVYALVVVLFSLILASGLGSALSDRLFEARPRLMYCFPVLIAAVALVALAVLPSLVNFGLTQPLPLKVLFVLLFTLPAGVLMGMGFPLGVTLARGRCEPALPWLWGINGGFSVLGSALAAIIGMGHSLSAAMAAGAGCYLALLIPIVVLRRGDSE